MGPKSDYPMVAPNCSRKRHELAKEIGLGRKPANVAPQPAPKTSRTRRKPAARGDDDRTEFLRKRGFSRPKSGRIIGAVLAEEGRPPESVFDFVQGITAVAGDKPHQDARLDMEATAKRLPDQAA